MKPIMTLPCKNRHSEMEKKGNGYHCKNCDHVLTDFRNCTSEEIQDIVHNSPHKICGVFNPSQLDYKVSHVQLPAFRAVGLSLLGILGFLGPVITSCESDPATEYKQKAFNQLKFPMNVSGAVEDEKTGKPLPYFKVELLQHNRVIKTVKTDKDGKFDILVNENDLDEEVFKLAIHRNGFENDTLASSITKFRNKKVKLTIKAEASPVVRTLEFVTPKIVECTTIEGEIMSPEPLGGIPAYDPPIEIVEKPIDQPVDEVIVGGVAGSEAEFPGGQKALNEHLKANLSYPKDALERQIGGRVYVRFIISEKGEVQNVRIQRGIPDCPECDKEAIRVIQNMPDWIPAENNDKRISSYYTLSIKFTP